MGEDQEWELCSLVQEGDLVGSPVVLGSSFRAVQEMVLSWIENLVSMFPNHSSQSVLENCKCPFANPPPPIRSCSTIFVSNHFSVVTESYFSMFYNCAAPITDSASIEPKCRKHVLKSILAFNIFPPFCSTLRQSFLSSLICVSFVCVKWMMKEVAEWWSKHTDAYFQSEYFWRVLSSSSCTNMT